jgi:hypothetical protein
MRFSPFAPRASQKLGTASDSNERFFTEVAKSVGQHALHGAILLVGARDTLALALRRAQGILRFDQRSSKWSHAALIVRWQDDAARSAGVEVTLDPADVRRQVPERNGVTTFELGRYFDEQRYPNVALLTFEFEPLRAAEGDEPTLPSPAERRALAIETALTPVRNRERFPLWDTLGAWARHAYLPYTTPNPLLEGMPMPCASLCEYAYEAAGIDLTPGATGNDNCHEGPAGQGSRRPDAHQQDHPQEALTGETRSPCRVSPTGEGRPGEAGCQSTGTQAKRERLKPARRRAPCSKSR